MSLINCEINLILTCCDKCVLSNDTKATPFVITDTKLYVAVVTLSTQDNATVLEEIKSGFKRTINWKKYEPKVSAQSPNPYLNFLTNPSFQGVNRLFALSFENNENRTVYIKEQRSTCRNKGLQCYDQWTKIFWSTSKNNWRTYSNFQKIATSQGDDYTTGFLLDYNYFNNYCKMIAIDLSKQQSIDADQKQYKKLILWEI